MIITRLSGGLGNQMFQYAFGIGQASRHGAELKIDASRYNTKNEPRTYALDAFAIDAPRMNFIDSLRYKKFGKKITEPRPGFSPEILDITSGYFSGNWQTEKYFKEFDDIVRQQFTLKEWSQAANQFKKDIEKTGNASVSLHVRRGDYAANSHLTQKHGLLSLDYYSKALKLIREKEPGAHVYVFSDDPKWVQGNFVFLADATYVSGSGLSPAEELSLMSLCRHHVIANSTYSWWGAWLDPWPDKLVVAPAHWYASGIDSKDLVPENWIRI